MIPFVYSIQYERVITSAMMITRPQNFHFPLSIQIQIQKSLISLIPVPPATSIGRLLIFTTIRRIALTRKRLPGWRRSTILSRRRQSTATHEARLPVSCIRGLLPIRRLLWMGKSLWIPFGSTVRLYAKMLLLWIWRLGALLIWSRGVRKLWWIASMGFRLGVVLLVVLGRIAALVAPRLVIRIQVVAALR